MCQQKISSEDYHHTLRQVAMVFQSYALFPHLSVERNLSLGMELRGVPRAEIQRELDQVLALMQLEGLRQRKPAEIKPSISPSKTASGLLTS